MPDRLFYRGKCFDLPNQIALGDGFWGKMKSKKPLVGHSAHHLRDEEYSCDWKVDGRKFWLLAVYLDDDGSDLLAHILNCEKSPVFADWHTGILSAHAEPIGKTRLGFSERQWEIPIIRFHVERGCVKRTEHVRIETSAPMSD